MFIGDNPQAHRLLKAFHRFRRLDLSKLTPSAFKPSEVRLMFIILRGMELDERGVTVSELSAMMEVASPTVTPLVRSLEEHGLVLRYNDKEDRRAVRVKLTEQGLDQIREIARKRSAQIQELVEYLGEEKSRQLIELLEQVYEYVEEQLNTKKSQE
ncbi:MULTISPECIES: MarR family winged helix-turn-helix transcriptional regulator [Paenibacillus]|uniref:MarR family winged helix-turn-helix transcriptional regulator n=1 Tax=Paenibacillus TaxID=44249 RepID=UPI00073F88DF|nr:MULTISPECIES: MarR family transcriptional regulator [Paenibacillus]MDU4695121.1 MarR family transcriptional regulator [Paenibacillus sp.]